MRTFGYIFPLLLVGLLVPGCSEDPGSLHQGADPYGGGGSGDPDGSDDDELPPSPAATPAAPPANASFSATTLARARLWVDVDMPYCGGPNGGRDVICGGTCSRTGTAKSADWDKYRSDCSGFISWAWGLPSPGETTRTLAPYGTKTSAVIAVEDLQPGDALNGAGHVMLFGGWADKAAGKALILHESRCGTTATEKIATFEVIDATTLKISDGRKFRAIRYKNAK